VYWTTFLLVCLYKELLEDFPFLTEADVLEALAFSARIMQDKYFTLEQAS